MFKKLIAMVIAVAMLATALTGCGGGAATTEMVSLNVGAEPRYLDPGLNNAIDSAMYIDHCFEGLTKVDKDAKTVPGMAKEWKESDDKLTYTFTLRDAEWSDGVAVKAQDFEYAWKRVLNPKTGSEYAYFLYFLKNGEEYNSEKAKAEDVGVKALDDKTLEVTLKAPMPYFIDLTHFTTLHPVRKDILEKHGDQWTQKPETYITNGAYTMKAWEHNSSLLLKKSDTYWDKDKININEIDWKLMEDQSTALNAFESGEILLNYDHIPTDEIPRLLKEGRLTIHPEVSAYYYSFNTSKKPFDDVRVRKALALAIDRKYIVEKVTKANEKPAIAFVPYGAAGVEDGKDFRTEAPDDKFLPETADIEQAKKLLAEAGFPGGKGLPEIELIYNTSDRHKKMAEAIQEQWKKNLGLSIKISGMEWKVIQQKRHNKDYVLARDGWVADYTDPMSFMDLMTSKSGNNNTYWKNDKYDELVKKAQISTDRKERFEAMHEAERILMSELPVLPIMYYTKPVMVDPKLKGVIITPTGNLYLHHAYLE